MDAKLYTALYSFCELTAELSIDSSIVKFALCFTLKQKRFRNLGQNDFHELNGVKGLAVSMIIHWVNSFEGEGNDKANLDKARLQHQVVKLIY